MTDAARPLTFDHLIGKKKPLQKKVAVVLDPDLAEAYEEARRAADLAHARVQVRPEDSEAAAQLLEADAALQQLRERLMDEGAVVQFHFRGIGRAAYEKLVDMHPATAEQRMKAKAGGLGDQLAWNPETLPPALVSACCTEPAMTVDQAMQLWNDPNWGQAELGQLVAAAVEVNGQRRTVDLGKDFRRTPNSEAKSPTA